MCVSDFDFADALARLHDSRKDTAFIIKRDDALSGYRRSIYCIATVERPQVYFILSPPQASLNHIIISQ